MSEVEIANPRESNKNRRIFLILFISGILILILWAGLKTWRIYSAASSLLSSQDQIEGLLADGYSEIDPVAAESLILNVRGDVVTLKKELDFLMPILPAMGWIPKIGPLLAVSPQLLEMADGGTEAAVYAFQGLKPGIALFTSTDDSSTTSRLPEILQVLDDAKPELSQASMSLDRVVKARETIGDVQLLPWRLRTVLSQLDDWLPLGQDGIKLAIGLPELLGHDQPRRYLIIAQNEDELRATGGFISGAGLIVVDDGQIIQIDFQDANDVDAWATENRKEAQLTKPYDPPPQPLTDFMLLDLFLFRDSNFWPDFPTSAEKAMELFSYGQVIPPVDGAIGIDQKFMELLLSATGPLRGPGSNEVINSKNIVESLQGAWTLQDGVSNRKAFLGTFALAIYDHLENNLSSVDPINFAKIMNEALNEKHMQIYVQDPLPAALIADIGWDGRLPPPNDYDALLIVDTNVGYNKANYFIDRDISYRVELAEDGSGVAELIVTHINKSPDNGEPCWQGTLQEYSDGAPYLELTDKCYWNYQRIYVPQGSQLISGPEHVVPGETWFGGYNWDRPTEVIEEIPGFSTFTNFMLVPRSSQVTSDYRYSLPNSITTSIGDNKQYRLRLYRQAGAPKHRTQIGITIPEGTKFLSSSPEPTAREENTLYFIIDLAKDEWISINYH